MELVTTAFANGAPIPAEYAALTPTSGAWDWMMPWSQDRLPREWWGS